MTREHQTHHGDASEPRPADKLSMPLSMNREQRRQWRTYVLGCVDLTAGHKVVLLALETFADYPAGTNARPGVERLADMCNLKTRAVECALQRGRDLDLIEQTARANPKRRLAAVYRLVSTRIGVRAETDFNPHETNFNPHENAFLPARACSPPIHTNPNTPSVGGGAAVEPLDAVPDQDGAHTPPDPDPRPPEFCKSHMPNGITGDCRFCMRHRQQIEAWEARNPHRTLDHLRPRPDRNAHDPTACDDCDEHGWRLDHDGRDGDRPMKCNGRKAS